MQYPDRFARTVVLKLKTADFRILTRSLTPERHPASLQQLAEIACGLRERVDLPARTRYRLVGVGLSGFAEGPQIGGQDDLFVDER
jgi:DNA polymerase-4